MYNPVLAWGVGACALVLALPAAAANGSMPNAMVRDSARRIELQQRALRPACEGMKRDANSVCASGAGPAREKVKKT